MREDTVYKEKRIEKIQAGEQQPQTRPVPCCKQTKIIITVL